MEKDTEKMREVFEHCIYGPLHTVMSPFVNEKARNHLNQARAEVLKAMRVFIDSEIEKLDQEPDPKREE